MKEHAEFKGMDIRAVENPYEAAFELAKKINLTARSTRNWIIVLYSFFSFYVILSMAVIYANLMVFNQSDLKYLGVAMGLLNIGLGCYAEWLLARSYKSFAFIYKDQELLGKIDGIGTGTFDGTVDAGGSVPPFHAQGLLDRLLKTMENDSEKLFKTSRIVLSFILLWMLNAVIYYSIQIYRFGLASPRRSRHRHISLFGRLPDGIQNDPKPARVPERQIQGHRLRPEPAQSEGSRGRRPA